MKNDPAFPMNIMVRRAALLLLLFSTINYQPSTQAQGTAFTYQGRLNDSGSPANGSNYGMVFYVYDAASGGSALGNLGIVSMPVSNGLFTVTLDFGAGVFTGPDRWVEIAVQKNGGPFTTLSPRQPLTPTPYAVFAENVGSGGIAAGTYGNAVTFDNPANSFSGNGAGLTNVNSATLGGLSSSSFWKLGGNTGANPTNGNFIGTTDNLPLEFKVSGARALRFEPNTNGAPNLIGGSPNNLVNNGVVGGTIGGGGAVNYNGAPYTNKVTASFGTAGGGAANAAGFFAIVGGGFENTASGSYSTVGGGQGNTAADSYATVGGGEVNSASVNDATVGGGDQNSAGGAYSTVGGGQNNTASGFAAAVGGGSANAASGDNSTVSGGNGNTAAGNYSFAAGNRAHAGHNGFFVWADNNPPFTFSSTTANQFRVRATGGVAFVTAIDASGNVAAGVHLLAGDTAWSAISDRNAKKNFAPVSGEAVLEKLAAMPIQQWNYKWESETNTPHLGPMAQDFKAAFYPGRDDKSISTLEFDGVELAAIQGLNQKLEQKETEMAGLKQKNELLEKRLDALEKAILNQKSN